MRVRKVLSFPAAVCVGVAGAALVAGELPGAAVAGTKLRGPAKPVVEFVTPTVRAGAVGRLDVDAIDARVCELVFAGPGGRRQGPFVVVVRRQHVRWRWRVPAGAGSGRWRATVSCARSSAALHQARHRGEVVSRFAVAGGRRRAPAEIVAPRSLRVGTFSRAPAGRAASTGGAVVGLGAGHNPFPFGQCTYHAYETRPDIYDYAVAHGIPRGGVASSARFGGIPDYWWNAWRWLSNAQRVGIPTGTTPVAGAIVVFPRGYGGSPVGHVAYVVSVYPNGTYLVSERNWDYNPNITYRLVYPGYPGVGFIYGGPAGNGPAPPATTSAPTTTSAPPATTSAPTTTSPPPTTTSAPTTTSPPPTTTTTQSTTPPPPLAYWTYNVYGVGTCATCVLYERSGPGYSSYAIVGSLREGAAVEIVCQTPGQTVTPNPGTPSDVWDRLTNGAYVTDVYVDTPGVGGGFSSPIPRC